MSANVVDDFSIDGVWVTSYRAGGKQYFTRSYSVWLDMMYRCKVGGKWQEKYPTYIGCSASDKFKNSQDFIKWSVEQISGGSKGYQLDKDVLFADNKLYSEDTCVFIPQALNKFLTDKASVRGPYPRGVHYNKVVGKLCSKISIDGKAKHLGYFLSEESAYSAYKTAKESEARRWAERLTSDEFHVNPLVIDIMKCWTVPEDK